MTKEEILSQYYGNVYEEPEEFIEIIKAMEQYRNEGLRDILLEYSKRYVFLPYPAQSGTHEDLVDEYLKQKP